ncbi:RagB/SusD family nutrient uptake outer membrane protein [Flavobacterium gawalongense]|uniref:RagB/SusD family nutrient uptake outer membrane protein n=1 Tax=Flavobacterium gawalongense TaxID=2594432 RepID=A0A553BSQ8_9FLAO|nr:RagB/SusD family nutrient uptake outer membrane protein [Flavobacterium gawalongense]TRX11273.1 RagB/SusD family nutrient uptake outer membrane protein [Flavobacterium gawalongense]TRX12266.1 RagB/SusD family nutrient uptake outer membrane protein [Flavobacterium gawalongense]TRX30195.1 RagB/SusD family nutrient uptake outer membrane protein [Flavobacterium gawalongense]
MKTNKIILFLLVSSMLTTSCEQDFLEQAPLDSNSEVSYFKNLTEFQAAANGLHTNVYAWGGSGEKPVTANATYGINHDWGSDIVSAGGDEGSGLNVISTGDLFWETTYKWLRAANKVIVAGEAYSNQEEIAGPIGQAYFFRAWNHFFLLKRYGGVPIANSVPDINSDLVNGSRASRYEVVKQILDDLDVAIAKLAKTTVTSTGNDGHVTLEAAKALKARVCLFEGTWDKYVGTKTDGDGTGSGTGSKMPSGYPTVTEFLTMAKNLSKEIIDGGKFELWKGVENVSNIASVKNPQLYKNSSYYYLFNLEGATSNPAGLTKASNKESIYRAVYDAVTRKSATNLTHTWPAGMTRKLSDMYLCTDGLPVHLSPLFKGYTTMNAELQNRDYRFTSCVTPVLEYAWGNGMYKTGAQYAVDIYTLSKISYQNIPSLRNGEGAVGGRKFRSELASNSAAGDEAMDYMFIRFAEVYLIYAEATCELGGGLISDGDLDYSINKVRARGGVAPLNAALLAKASSLGGQLTFLGEIRRERALELYSEGQRINDLCRWGIAEAELGGQPRCGGYLSYNGTDSFLKTMINPIDNKPVYIASSYGGKINTSDFSFTYSGLTPTKAGAIIIEQTANRKFALKHYLKPIPSGQIQLNASLKQNPGW